MELDATLISPREPSEEQDLSCCLLVPVIQRVTWLTKTETFRTVGSFNCVHSAHETAH